MHSPIPGRWPTSAICPSSSPEARERRRVRRPCRGGKLDHAAPDLVLLDGLEQRAEVALAEALVALPLDDLEEDRADDVPGEDLQQQPLALLGIAVDQDAALAQLVERLAVAGDARADALIISVGCVLESHAVPAQHVHRTVDVLGRERDV